MGTKNNPGTFDCYANALPDEPMFVMLGRDLTGAACVGMWAAIRFGDEAVFEMAVETCRKVMIDRAFAGKTTPLEKIAEATNCADQMRQWYTNQ